MARLDREGLLQKEELEVVRVDLDDNGTHVFVRQMTGRERDRFEQSLLKEVRDKRGNIDYKRSLEDFRAKLAVHCVCDEDGNNLLQPGDTETLSTNMSAFKLERIVNEAQRLNLITQEDKDALVKKSEGVLDEDSPSGSAVS